MEKERHREDRKSIFLKDVHKAHEVGLFYYLRPNKWMFFKEKVVEMGRNLSKH